MPSLCDRQIDAARDVDGVVRAVRDYVDTLTPGQLAHLPGECRPGRIKTEEDIMYWVRQLSHHRCRLADADAVEILQYALDHFLHAYERLYELARTRA